MNMTQIALDASNEDSIELNKPGRYLVPIGRVLFSAIFLMAGSGHFSAQTIAYAAHEGVPLAAVLVPLSGVLALVGGLSVALGYRARWGAVILIAFLVPVTFGMHRLWAVSDPMFQQLQMVMFMKNVAMTGAALLIGWFGAGPVSLDARRSERQ